MPMALPHLSIVFLLLAVVKEQQILLMLAMVVQVAEAAATRPQVKAWAVKAILLIQLPIKVMTAAQVRLHLGAVLRVAVVLMPSAGLVEI